MECDGGYSEASSSTDNSISKDVLCIIKRWCVKNLHGFKKTHIMF